MRIYAILRLLAELLSLANSQLVVPDPSINSDSIQSRYRRTNAKHLPRQTAESDASSPQRTNDFASTRTPTPTPTRSPRLVPRDTNFVTVTTTNTSDWPDGPVDPNAMGKTAQSTPFITTLDVGHIGRTIVEAHLIPGATGPYRQGICFVPDGCYNRGAPTACEIGCVDPSGGY